MSTLGIGPYPPDIHPAAVCEHEANVDGADVMLWRPADPDCPRHVCEWCCNETCCRMCHAADQLMDDDLCGSCRTEVEMDEAELACDDCRRGDCEHSLCRE